MGSWNAHGENNYQCHRCAGDRRWELSLLSLGEHVIGQETACPIASRLTACRSAKRKPNPRNAPTGVALRLLEL